MHSPRQTARCLGTWLGAAALITMTSGAGARMPRGAYLRRPARSTTTLLAQLRGDARVLTRYARVFRMPPSAVLRAMQGLVPTRVRRDQLVRVYYVHAGERIGYKVRRLRRGTPVFALPNGVPALAMVCGNPLCHDLPMAALPVIPGPVDYVLDFSPQEPLGPVASGPPDGQAFTPDVAVPPAGQWPPLPPRVTGGDVGRVAARRLVDWVGTPSLPMGANPMGPAPAGLGDDWPPVPVDGTAIWYPPIIPAGGGGSPGDDGGPAPPDEPNQPPDVPLFPPGDEHSVPEPGALTQLAALVAAGVGGLGLARAARVRT